jgi:UrcA family protein
MPVLTPFLSSRRGLAAALAVGGLLFAAAPAAAQTVVDEVTVMGGIGPDGRPDRLSRAVSYADLDLVYKADRDELKARIRWTARDLCRELGETGVSGLTPSCENAAVREAMAQARIAFAEAPERHYAILMRQRAYEQARLAELTVYD